MGKNGDLNNLGPKKAKTMTRYKIGVPVTATMIMEIEAESENQALEIAQAGGEAKDFEDVNYVEEEMWIEEIEE